jgi:hypothetical protein
MVTIDLITGFLGSGKTTFLKKYAEYLMDQGLHIGILENDFGAINVDMLMLHELRGDQCELEMIAGGCDAESHRRRFRTKLISMRMCGYDRVLVEPLVIFQSTSKSFLTCLRVSLRFPFSKASGPTADFKPTSLNTYLVGMRWL